MSVWLNPRGATEKHLNCAWNGHVINACQAGAHTIPNPPHLRSRALSLLSYFWRLCPLYLFPTDSLASPKLILWPWGLWPRGWVQTASTRGLVTQAFDCEAASASTALSLSCNISRTDSVYTTRNHTSFLNSAKTASVHLFRSFHPKEKWLPCPGRGSGKCVL